MALRLNDWAMDEGILPVNQVKAVPYSWEFARLLTELNVIGFKNSTVYSTHVSSMIEQTVMEHIFIT